MSLLICVLLFSLSPFSALAALPSAHPVRFRRDGDPTGSDQPNDSDDGGDDDDGGKHKGGSSSSSSPGSASSSSTASSSATSASVSGHANNTSTSAVSSDSASIHPEGIVGVIIAVLAVGLIVGLTIRWWMTRRREKAEEARAEAEEAAANTPANGADMAQTQKTWVVASPTNMAMSPINRALPAVPRDVGEDDDSDSDATPRASNFAHHVLRNEPASTSMGIDRSISTRQSRRLSGVDIDAELARSPTAREPRARGYVPTFVPVLPNPFNSNPEVSHSDDDLSQRALPHIRTQIYPDEGHHHIDNEGPSSVDSDTYAPSFMSSPTASHLTRSLTFSSALAPSSSCPISPNYPPAPQSPSSPTSTKSPSIMTAYTDAFVAPDGPSVPRSTMVPLTLSFSNDRIRDHYESIIPHSPSQWLSRSPTGSKRNSTLLEDLVVHQKQLEAHAHTDTEIKPDPPPKYCIDG